MKTYQIEEIAISEARSLSGVTFVIKEKGIAVSEEAGITLLVNSAEGFTHVKEKVIFIYHETESEDIPQTDVIWVCGLIEIENNNVLMLKEGRDKFNPLDKLLYDNLNKLIYFPNFSGQYIRFDYNENNWELVLLPNMKGTDFILRRYLVGTNRIAKYDPTFEYKNYTQRKGLYPIIESFKQHLDTFYATSPS